MLPAASALARADRRSTWTNSAQLYVGYESTGELIVRNGGSVSNTNGWLGHSGGSGTVAISDSGSMWESTGDLSLGRSSSSGIGHLTTSDHGTLHVGDAAYSGGAGGTLIVSDGDESGTAGGHLYVYNGSTLSQGSGAIVGLYSGQYGWATVDGAGSTWTNAYGLCVGLYGTGTLEITGGGSVSNNFCVIGSVSGSTGTVTVNGEGSTWTNNGGLYVAIHGSGTLAITGGGLISVGGT